VFISVHLWTITVLKSEVNMERVFVDDILRDKVAFVTGGGTGITGGVARAFAEHGAKLAITSRKEENLAAMMRCKTQLQNPSSITARSTSL
jgi:NADP-dependent 3-hydroxy acid dehydrogenase YdfG